MTSKLGLKLGEVRKEAGTDYTQLCPEHQVSFLSKDAPRQCNGGTGSSGARGAAWRDGVGGVGGAPIRGRWEDGSQALSFWLDAMLQEGIRLTEHTWQLGMEPAGPRPRGPPWAKGLGIEPTTGTRELGPGVGTYVLNPKQTSFADLSKEFAIRQNTDLRRKQGARHFRTLSNFLGLVIP